ncbi:MAG: VWA domain-containing protein [Candidatus Acidiferrales bacterium]
MANSFQAQSVSTDVQQTVRVATEIVRLNISVLANDGSFMGGLEQKNFRILDNGAEQPIVFFAPEDQPAHILVLLETSPAVYLIQDQHLSAAYALLEGLAPGDQVSLATYDDAPHSILPFTANKAALTNALGQIQYSLGMGQLNLFDSLATVLDQIASTPGKKALILLTTGLDSSSSNRWDALVRKVRTQDVVIFPVALGGSLRHAPDKKKKTNAPESATAQLFENADRALFALASMTGGYAFFPVSPKDFIPVYHEIAAALRHQYVLGIAPQHDGTFHPLSVQVLDANGQPAPKEGKNSVYQVFLREGYLAPGQNP